MVGNYSSIALNHPVLDGLANPCLLEAVASASAYPGIVAPSGGFNGATAALGAYGGSVYTQWQPQLTGSAGTQIMFGTITYQTQ